ncbi:hypothetical protein BJV78DRAFT_1159007 [Lactifluus subvellereus]|nr:hypothetical protein BJV78DRAFT_1159007 [Lactifluus subvellereus]
MGCPLCLGTSYALRCAQQLLAQATGAWWDPTTRGSRAYVPTEGVGREGSTCRGRLAAVMRPLALRNSEVMVRRVVGGRTQTEEGCDRIGGLHERGVLSARAPATHYTVPNSFWRRLQRASAEEASRWVAVIGPGAQGWGSILASPANVVPVLGMTRALTYY